MKSIHSFFLLCLFILIQQIVLAGGSFAEQVQTPDRTKLQAQNLLRSALEAMGGEVKIRALKIIQFEGIGHIFAVEQSERPEGPWIVNYLQISEIRDLLNQRVRTTTRLRNSQITQWVETTQIVADGIAAAERAGKFFPATFLQAETATQNLALAPERILIDALESTDVRLEKDIQMQSVRQKVVKFTWHKIPVTIYLNSDTNLPTAVETINTSPYDHFWTIWGDYPVKTYYTYWTLEKGGIRYPHQWDVERINMPYSSFTITKMEIDKTLESKDFIIPDDVKQKFAVLPKPVKIDEIPLGRPDRPAKEIAPGVVKLSGRWDVAFVKQTDGIVIIEAPISSGYSAKVLEEAKKRFPDAKVKAVITTSDAFPHLGGVREYAARGIPIYGLDLNRPILERLLSASYASIPDLLQNSSRRTNFKIISNKTILGDGSNRLELYPIRTETGERMMMIYFPEHKLLYASDLVQKSQKGGFFMQQYLSEVIQAAKRENLEVNNVFAMHTDLTPWAELTNDVEMQINGK